MQRARRSAATAATPHRASSLEMNDENSSNSNNHHHHHHEKYDDSLEKYSPTNRKPSSFLSSPLLSIVGIKSPQRWPLLFGAITVGLAWLLIVGDALFGPVRIPIPIPIPIITTTTTTTTSYQRKNQQLRQGQNNINPEFSKAFGSDGIEYHMIFSTGCSTFQDWQSYVFFYHAWKSGQPGHVTRIASGCSEESAHELQQIYREQIDIMSPGRFHIHITPEYSRIKPKVDYKYFNKPFGVKHWMEHVLGYPKDKSHDDAIVILLDPDQIVLRPFWKDFSNSTEVWNPNNSLKKFKVEHGTPFAQEYGFGSQWRTKTNMTYVSPSELPSPVDQVSIPDAERHYAAGPPYMATARDMYAIVEKWTEFVPRIHDQYPHLLAEMFGYCVAAAHLKLPHQMAWSFMVSDVTGGEQGEGWALIDKYQKSQVCGNQIPRDQLPHVIHYCQRYNLGKWFFAKHRLPTDFISCGSNLIREPPVDVAVQYDFGVRPWQEVEIWRFPHVAKRHGFMLCTLIQAMNDAAIFFKQHNCPAGTANFVKNFTFFNESMVVEQKWFEKAKSEFKLRPMIPDH